MLRITRQADYGFVLLSTLARCPGRKAWTAGDLASSSHIPLSMVSKILKRLTHEGILASQRGARGGYRLARDPGDITVRAVIDVLEGPIAITECVDPNGNCDLQCWCPVHPSWQQINAAILGALEGITLADMTRPEPTLPVKAAEALGRLS